MLCSTFLPQRPAAQLKRHAPLASTSWPLQQQLWTLQCPKRPQMWLDGDPKLFAYFFLNIISGVLCTLLLISFGATKHIRRYIVYTLS